VRIVRERFGVLSAIADGARGALDDPSHATLVATTLAVPVRALGSGVAVPLVLHPRTAVSAALRRTIARYPTLLAAVAAASYLVSPPGWLVEMAGVDLGAAAWLPSGLAWWAGVKLGFLPVIAVAEGRPFAPTVVAAWRLTDGRWWRTLLLGALAAALLGLSTGALLGVTGFRPESFVFTAALVGFVSVIDVFYAAAYRQMTVGPPPDAAVPGVAAAPASAAGS